MAASRPEFALGTAVELLYLDELGLNGLHAIIIGPLMKGRQRVKFQGRQASIKSENLRVLRPGEEALSVLGGRPGAAEATPADLSRQSSVGKEYDKNVSYLVGMCDFERLPRWPGDGIEEESDKMRESHMEFSKKCKRQKAYERIMGGWPSAKPLRDFLLPEEEMGLGMIFGIPNSCQERAARKCYNHKAAIDYLYKQRRLPGVKAVLKKAWEGGPHKLGGDRSRFPGLRRFIAVLMRKGLATDENFELLFGDAMHVRYLALEIGHYCKDPPPPTSPAERNWADVLDAFANGSPLKQPEKKCANCFAEVAQGSSGGNALASCSGCKSVYYCNRTCQNQHWVIHKPDCLDAQGKVPKPESVAAAAAAEEERAQAEKRRPAVVEAARKERAEQAAAAKFCNDTARAFIDGSWVPPSKCWDIQGAFGRPDCPSICGITIARTAAESVGLDADVTQEYQTGREIRGIPDSPCGSGTGAVWVLGDGNGTYIMVTVTRLYDRPIDGKNIAYTWHGVYVASRLIDLQAEEMLTDLTRGTGREVEWEAVQKPQLPSSTNQFDLLVSWLSLAKREATIVTHGVYSQGSAAEPGHSVQALDFCGERLLIITPKSFIMPKPPDQLPHQATTRSGDE